MKFIVSTTACTSKTELTSKIGKFYYWFDDRVNVVRANEKITFSFGVSWPIPLVEVTDDTIEDQSGSWFYGTITPSTVTVYTNAFADYPTYYSYNSDSGFLVSNVLNEFSPKQFRPNVSWILDVLNRNLFRDRCVPAVKFNIVNHLYRPMDPVTPVTGVSRMPAGAKMVFNGLQLNVELYYEREKEYDRAATLPKLTHLEEYVAQKLRSNVSHIAQQNSGKKLGVMSSTGIDSLSVVRALLDQNINFKLASYSFAEHPKLRVWGNNADRLHDYLSTQYNIETIFDVIESKKFFDRFIPESWVIPSFFNDLYQETYAAKTLLGDCDYLVKGTNGDECFLHTHRFAMIFLATSTNMSFDEALAECKTHYAYQENFLFLRPEEFALAQQYTCHDAIRDTWTLKPMTYLSDDQVLLNKPIYSPYCDKDLVTITARMNEQDLKRSILDADVQKERLGDLTPFLNKYKSGEEEIQEFSFPLNSASVDALNYLQEFAKEHNIEDVLSNTLSTVANKKSGDVVPYSFLKIVQLSTWIQNWQSN